VAEHPHAWKMLFRDTTGDSDRAFRGEVQTRAHEVVVAVLEAQQDSAIPEEEIEPLAELLRSGMAGLAL
jgi:hypothetical protein